MASPPGVKPLEPNQRRPRLAELPGDGRGTTTTTPLPGTDIIPNDRRTRVECLPLLHALGPFNGPLTSRYPMSINMNLSRTQEAGWPSTPPPLDHRSIRGRDDCILPHCPRARRTAMATASTSTLHRRLERLQSALHCKFSVPLRQTGATMRPQIHQAPGGRNSLIVPQKVPDHEKSYPRGHRGGRDRGLLQRIQ
jgi:hypothetical protein